MSLTFIASAISGGSTIVIPAGAQAGDLAVLLDYSQAVGVPADVVPTNWTGIIQVSVDGALGAEDMRIRASYKKLVGGDPGATITGMTGSDLGKVMFVFRPSIPITTITPSTWNAQAASANPTQQTVSASGQPTPLVVIGGAFEDGSVAAFTTASPAFDATVTTAAGDGIGGYKIYNSSPADHSIDMNDLGSANGLISGYLRVE